MKFAKRLILLAIVFAFAALPMSVVAQPAASAVTIDGQPVVFDGAQAVNVDGRILVPVRGVFEALGFEVEWQEGTRTAVLTRGGFTIRIMIGSDTFTANGVVHDLDVPAQIIQDRTMLPIRAVVESVGYDVDWDEANRIIVITTGGQPSPTAEPTPAATTEVEATPTPTPTPSPTEAAPQPPTTAALPAGYHWVGTWASSQYFGDVNSGNGGIRSAGEVARDRLAGATLRQMVRTAIAGDSIRLTFSNQFGQTDLVINAASVARASGSPGSSGINTATHTPITFGGSASVTLAPGEFVTSDTLNFPVEALERLAVSTYFGEVPARITSHIAARANSFVQPGNHISSATVTGSVNTHWFVLCNVDVVAPTNFRSIVVLGDSITDGFGVTNEAYTRWVDILMNNLQGNAATRHLSVINMGIGGNGLVGGPGGNPPAARHLLQRDVLDQPGVGYVVFQIGVNNIAFSPSVSAASMINAYSEMIEEAHAAGIRVIGGTITPHNEDRDYRDQIRNEVNDWMRQQYADGVIWGLIDFDAILRDPGNPRRLAPTFDRDGIHPTNSGYRLMGETLFDIMLEYYR
ncbi:MAG: stalk domain-containing protein [Defluviitaleaceae bacterium]|nr:stalk domain-containing protein [Defluviitaleaceae bacterium]